mmetsp:Transcript_116760/g.330310  ORF Transcript_116760/g.330310 Transcript_116760/m.330310 type:complete len:472 (+) Transcript_116760:60-1475(+)
MAAAVSGCLAGALIGGFPSCYLLRHGTPNVKGNIAKEHAKTVERLEALRTTHENLLDLHRLSLKKQEGTLEAVQMEVDALHASHGSISAGHQTALSERDLLQQHRDELAEKHASAVKELMALRTSHNELIDGHQQSLQEREALRTSHKKLSDGHQAALDERDALRRHRDEYETKHAAAMAECDAMRRSLNDAESMRRRERDELEKMNAMVKEAHDALHVSSEATTSELRAQLANAEELCSCLTTQLEHTKADNDQMHNIVDNLKTQMTHLQTDVVTKQPTAQEFLRKIKAIEERGNIQFNLHSGKVTFLKAITFKTRIEGKDPPSAEFADPTEVEMVLQDVADIHGIFNENMIIEGHTMRHTGPHDIEWVRELSENRARLVVEQLMRHGVPEGSMTATGLHGNHPDSVGRSCVIIHLMIFDDVRTVPRDNAIDSIPPSPSSRFPTLRRHSERQISSMQYIKRGSRRAPPVV